MDCVAKRADVLQRGSALLSDATDRQRDCHLLPVLHPGVARLAEGVHHQFAAHQLFDRVRRFLRYEAARQTSRQGWSRLLDLHLKELFRTSLSSSAA